MLKTTATFEVTNGLVLAEHVGQVAINRRAEEITPRLPEMKWVTTERGLEARWLVRPRGAAHFVLRNRRLVWAAPSACR